MNEASFPSIPFLSAKATASELFGINMDEDTFVELAWLAYKDIGNRSITNYIAKLPVNSQGLVELPDNLETIDSVTTTEIPLQSLEDSGYYLYDQGLPLSKWFFTQANLNDTVRHFDLTQNPEISPGALVSYSFVEADVVKVHSDTLKNKEVYVTYRGTIVDDSCLPLLTFKESQAISYRVAFLKTQRDVFANKPGSMDILGYIRQESARLMQAAKIPETISQNALDAMLDAKTSWGRKTYGKSFKPSEGR